MTVNQEGGRCILCGQPRDQFKQSFPAKYNKPDRLYETCWNPDCKAYGITDEPHHLDRLDYWSKI